MLSLTRDVTSLLKAWIKVQQLREDQGSHLCGAETRKRKKDVTVWIPISGLVKGMKRSQISVLGDGTKSMNEVFGDPCPGISKRLKVSYILTDASISPESSNKQISIQSRAASAEVHHATFAEHEAVVLRRRSRKTEHIINSPESTRSKIQSFASALTAETLEIALPLFMPFLGLNDRVQCRLVCNVWRDIIEDWGVATTIDSSDPSFPTFTRPFFRGILSHSHSGLHSLFLSGFCVIDKTDFHPSIPHLRSLRTLDISHCRELDDSTLQLLATHCHTTLQVLYMKGVRKITDDGLLAICQACHHLRVVDASSNMEITDRSGVAIGQNLGMLEAIYMRDNYKITNATIESITNNCKQLSQLSLWGCIGITKLNESTQMSSWTKSHLAVLNLWGCHNLQDNVANTFMGMKNLRTLVVSECFRLSDDFVVSLPDVRNVLSSDALKFFSLVLQQSVCKWVPGLQHFHLRYCKMLSDVSIYAISRVMQSMYSLDLSFCTKPSARAIADLLEERADTLFELRLLHCHQLNILGTPDRNRGEETMGMASALILKSLRSTSATNCLCVLDARHCTGQQRQNRRNASAEPSRSSFSSLMADMSFEEKSPAFFTRAVRWDAAVESSLEEHFSLV